MLNAATARWCRVAVGDVEYTAGRESVEHYNESLAGARQVRCIRTLVESCRLMSRSVTQQRLFLWRSLGGMALVDPGASIP